LAGVSHGELLLPHRFEDNDEEGSEWAEEQREEEPREAGAVFGLGETGIDQGECAPADCVLRRAWIIYDCSKHNKPFRFYVDNGFVRLLYRTERTGAGLFTKKVLRIGYCASPLWGRGEAYRVLRVWDDGSGQNASGRTSLATVRR
jgi:hypothetical protein